MGAVVVIVRDFCGRGDLWNFESAGDEGNERSFSKGEL
jgi:hypothetical protein